MLLGQYTSKLTDKDRISLPKKFRKELGEEIILAKWYENSLVIVNHDSWEGLQKRLVGEKILVIEPVRDIDRFILGSAFELKLDKQGRFVIPELLREYAEIKGEVVFVGLIDRVELWSKDNWSKLENDAEEKASKALEHIAKKGGDK